MKSSGLQQLNQRRDQGSILGYGPNVAWVLPKTVYQNIVNFEKVLSSYPPPPP